MPEVTKYWKESPLMASLYVLFIISITFAAWDSLIVMEDRWATSEEYGYAYMIPLITGYFVWQNKIKLQQIEYELSWVGGLLLVFGVFLILLGVLSATHSFSQYGYIVSLISTALLFMGWKAFKIIATPMLLLFLVVPIPTFIFNNLSADLQLISSHIGVWVIRAFGISVYLEGNIIDLGSFKLQVVEACSGLRYLFPLFSLSVIAAFLYRAAFWKRVVVVFSSIPITVFMNSFRIGVIGVLVEYGGIEQAEGFLHDFEGWFVFMACVGLLVLEMWLLVSFGKNKQKLSEAFALELPDNIPSGVHLQERGVSWKYSIPTVIVLIAGIVIGTLNERAEIIPERTRFATYPLQLEEWSGRRDVIEKQYLDELRLDDYIIANYSNRTGDVVNLYMAYYETQRSGAAAHSPKSCIPGGGWKIQAFNTIDLLGIEKNGLPLSANRLLIKKGEHGQLVYYWFQQRNRIITNEYMVKWYLFWDALSRNRTDGALVRLTTPISPGEDISKADERLVSLAKKSWQFMSEYIPN